MIFPYRRGKKPNPEWLKENNIVVVKPGNEIESNESTLKIEIDEHLKYKDD